MGDDPAAAPADEPGGVTWVDIYDSPEVDRSLRRLPRLCREAVQLVWAAGRRELLIVLGVKAVNGIGLAAVLLLGKGVLDGVLAAGRSGAGAEAVLPKLLVLTMVTAGLGFLSAVGRAQRRSWPSSPPGTPRGGSSTSPGRSSWRPTNARPSTTGWSGRPGAGSSGPGRSWRG